MLAGKRILVTGAGRGIGRAIARACLREGAVVGANVRREMPLDDALLAVPFDVRDPQAVADGVARFLEIAGGIDGLVNNAGVNLGALLVSASVESLRATLDTNLLGPLLCARAVLPAMLQQRSGVILNVSSVAAERPSRGQTAYAATKGGLESLTRALAVEYGKKGIRALTLRPGPVDTAMLDGVRAALGDEVLGRVPLRRLGTPEEIAELAVFLLSDRASFLTGSLHAADGGYGIG